MDSQRAKRAVGIGPSAPSGRDVRECLLELGRLATEAADTISVHVRTAARIVCDALRDGRVVLACGNGGSAADAQHFVAELVGRMTVERRSLPAVALTADAAVLTALGNDYGYEFVFSRQIEGLARPGDVLVAISTSGRSPNVLRAVGTAQRRGLRTIAFLGSGGATELETCDVCIHVPSRDAQRVQELHMALLHGLCVEVESLLTDDTHDPRGSGR